MTCLCAWYEECDDCREYPKCTWPPLTYEDYGKSVTFTLTDLVPEEQSIKEAIMNNITVEKAKAIYEALQTLAQLRAQSVRFDDELRCHGRQIDMKAIHKLQAECAVVMARAAINSAVTMPSGEEFFETLLKKVTPIDLHKTGSVQVGI